MTTDSNCFHDIFKSVRKQCNLQVGFFATTATRSDANHQFYTVSSLVVLWPEVFLCLSRPLGVWW